MNPLRSKLYFIYVSVIFLLLLNTVLQRASNYPRTHILWSDSEGYYSYLPAVFILKNVHKLPAGSVMAIPNAQGEHVNKYTCGVAILEMPFFLIAKWYCQIKGYDWKDYFNIHYVRAMAISGYFYGCLGLFFLAAALQRRFSQVVTFWTILSVFLGTNLFFYMTRAMSMSHAYSFCVFAFILWQLPRFYRLGSALQFIILGAATALSVLIRPTNAVILIFILLYDVYALSEFVDRLRFLARSWKKIVLAAFAAFIVLIPQLLYWYEMTGSILRYSYVDEGFIYWLRPKILAVLFDVQNGLFLYSPMALLMVIGIAVGLRTRQYQSLSLAIIFCLITYLFASWWAWWFGGAFGHRSYVEFYAMFAVPLAGFYEYMFRKNAFVKVLTIAVSAFLMFYGVKMALLYTYLPGPWDGADWRWNWEKIEWIWSYLFKPMK